MKCTNAEKTEMNLFDIQRAAAAVEVVELDRSEAVDLLVSSWFVQEG